MKPATQENQQAGLGAFEVIVVVATLVLLAGLVVLYPRKRVSGVNYGAACQSNLKQIALAQLVWADDHAKGNGTNDLPAADPDILKHLGSGGIASYYKALSNELVAPRILKCPSENRNDATNFSSLTASHVSYFLNLDATSGFDASIVVNGDRHISFTPPPDGKAATVTTNISVHWTKNLGHDGFGNVSFMDGSVQTATSHELTDALLAPSRTAGCRLLFP